MIIASFVFVTLGKWFMLCLVFLVGFISLKTLKRTKLNVLAVVMGLLIISFVTFYVMAWSITIISLYIGIVLLITPMTLGEDEDPKTEKK
jgi:predicted Co/Zn/Cd cation transporter (cation efflux family)